MVFNSISKVDVVDSLFEADVVIHLEWELPVATKEKFLSLVGDRDGGNDEINVYRVADMDGAIMMAGSVPSPVFQNLLGGKEVRQDLVQLFNKNPNGNADVPVKRVFRLLGTFFQGFRCEYFPFDVQGLQIKTVSGLARHRRVQTHTTSDVRANRPPDVLEAQGQGSPQEAPHEREPQREIRKHAAPRQVFGPGRLSLDL